MYKIEVRTLGNAEIRERLLKVGSSVRLNVSRTLREIGTEIRDAAAAAAPRKTGKLAQSIKMRLVEKGESFKVTVGPPAFYGKFLERGVVAGKAPATASHGIRGYLGLRESKREQAGRIERLRGTGEWRISPRPFMAPAIERVSSRVDSMLEASIARAMAEGE